MKTVYQLEFFDSDGKLLRISHRCFSCIDDASAYGLKVLDCDRVTKSFQIRFLFLD